MRADVEDGAGGTSGADEAFCQLMLAGIIEPTSKEGRIRVLDEVRTNPPRIPIA